MGDLYVSEKPIINHVALIMCHGFDSFFFFFDWSNSLVYSSDGMLD